jgi:hypothetical protein
MPAPVLVQFEKEIDREIAKEGNLENGNDYDEEEDMMELIEYGPQAQIVTNDLRSLDEMVSFDLSLFLVQLPSIFHCGPRCCIAQHGCVCVCV